MTGGLLLGSLTATSINLLLTPSQIADGFWRAPFLLGGVFGFIAMLLRQWLSETPVFEEMRKRAAISRELPLRAVLRAHRAAVVASMASTWMLTAAIVVVILMTPSLLQQSFGLAPGDTLLANLAGTAALCLSAVAVGMLTDRFGVRRVLAPMAVLLVAGAYALYIGAAQMPHALLPLYVLAGAGTGIVSLTPIVMVRAFPAAVRFSGLSFSYNVAYAIFGGVTPLFISWLSHLDRFAPAHYIAGVTLIGVAATLLAPIARSP